MMIPPHLIDAVLYVEREAKAGYAVKMLDANGRVTSFATCTCREIANDIASAIRTKELPEIQLRLNGDR